MKKDSPKVLLHACCGICSSFPVEKLREDGYEPVVYFYNPNIFPETEYQKRLSAQKKLCESLRCELVVGEYNQEVFEKASFGLENEPERGKRCEKCFELRLFESATKAKELEIEYFTTSIVISPHKNLELIASIGDSIAKNIGVEYLNINFRKQDGLLKTNKIANDLNLYRQDYCGCKYSIRS